MEAADVTPRQVEKEMDLFKGLLPSGHVQVDEDGFIETSLKKRRTASTERGTGSGAGSEQKADHAQQQQQKQKKPQTKGRGKGQQTKLSDKQMNDLVIGLTRLAIRHEDGINSLRQDSGFMLFMHSQPPGMVDVLVKMAEQWKELRLATPTAIASPLRLILFRGLVVELHSRVQLLLAGSDTKHILEGAKEAGVLDKDNNFVFRKWNPQTESMENLEQPVPLSAKQVQDMLQELTRCLIPQVIHRFHSTRPLTAPTPQSKVLPFMFWIS